jgi:hypothetical protein
LFFWCLEEDAYETHTFIFVCLFMARPDIHERTAFIRRSCRRHLTAPRGSLILWDSRTVHWNQHPGKDRPYNDNPKVRMVGYLCYVPKARLTNEGRAHRREAFETGVSTGHNPAYPELKRTKDHIKKEFEQYLEDPSYTQPKINLTPLGESLLCQLDY